MRLWAAWDKKHWKEEITNSLLARKERKHIMKSL